MSPPPHLHGSVRPTWPPVNPNTSARLWVRRERRFGKRRTLPLEPGPAEQLPFADGTFNAALAQLVVHFMVDPVAGLAEMVRVTRPGGVLAACVWDFAGSHGPLGPFWRAAGELAAGIEDESRLAGTRAGHLAELFAAAGLREVEETALSVSRDHASFDDWWEPFTRGVGPAGSYVARLDARQRDELRERCRSMLPAGSFTITARAWAARGVV